MEDSELLSLVSDERKRAIGLDHDETLRSEREQALNYYKGEMPDMTARPGRSRAVSTDVAEAIDTVLPDLVEIFTGEEVVAFIPKGEEDEEAAEQETDYINHVFFNENPGFLLLHTAIKDALLTKVGVFTWWAEDYEESEEFEGTLEEVAVALAQHGEDAVEVGEATPQGLRSYKITRKGKKPCAACVPSEDFAVSRDAVRIRDIPYCAMRSRPRAYELIQRGIPADQVAKLEAYGTSDEEIDLARDTAGEHDEAVKGSNGDYRVVEVVTHFLRKPEGGYWRVLTDATDAVLLEKEEVAAPRFAVLTPYVVPHRLIGESVADKLIEVQKIKTALTRMALDSGYFALNQRPYVDMSQAGEWTISDLLRNEPGVPIRGKGPAAVAYLQSGALSFDAFGALEYFSTQAEQRTGIVRNAQGLNPDTLHDTAKGAMALMTAAQKRVRMIARVFAETGLKDLFLGLHALIRETASGPLKARLRNKWVQIDPTSWGVRNDMTIEIGVGASGKEAQTIMLQQGLEVVREVITMQGGVNGPFITADNAYAFLKRFFEKGLDFKSADPFLTDPASLPSQEPQPDPAMMEAQAKLQIQAEEGQMKLELERERAEGQRRLAEQKAIAEMELAQARADMDARLAEQKLQAEIAQKERQLAMEIDLQERLAMAEIAMKERLGIHANQTASLSQVEPGGDPG